LNSDNYYNDDSGVDVYPRYLIAVVVVVVDVDVLGGYGNCGDDTDHYYDVVDGGGGCVGVRNGFYGDVCVDDLFYCYYWY
jgi:hypothetical protein